MKFQEFVELCRDADTLIRELKNKNLTGLGLQGRKPINLKASAIHYLAKKRRLKVTLNDLYQIYGKQNPSIIHIKKAIRQADEENAKGTSV